MANGVFTSLGANNGYVPNHAASQGLVVAFQRETNEFPLTKYCQIVTCDEMTGLYLRMTTEDAGRIAGSDDRSSEWPDGAVRPNVDGNGEQHRFENFSCKRTIEQDTVGDLSKQQASWNVVQQKSATLGQKAMTKRTRAVLTALTDAAAYETGHVESVASIPGNSGTWAQSTVSRQDIKRSLNFGFKKINLATLSKVRRSDLKLVLSPACAMEISSSPEIVNLIANSVHSKAYIEGKLWDGDWLLPQYIYGIEVAIEDTSAVSSKKGAATVSKNYLLSESRAMLIARPGGLMGLYGSPSFSSVTLFVHNSGNLAVETLNDVDNKRTVISVIDNRDVRITSPLSSFLFEDVL